jgi:tetratricopeptide (TPR) repeat protein
MEQLLKMLEDVPDEPFVLFAVAQEFSKKGDRENALRYYEKLTKSNPDYTGAYYHLGKLYEQLGRNDDAITAYKSGMEITQKKGEHHAYGELKAALQMISDEE